MTTKFNFENVDGHIHIEIDGHHNDIVHLLSFALNDHPFIMEILIDAIDWHNKQKFKSSEN